MRILQSFTASVAVAVIVAGTLVGQDRETFYAFDDRAPKTRVEKTIAKILPSIVKVHGASGLKTATQVAPSRSCTAQPEYSRVACARILAARFVVATS